MASSSKRQTTIAKRNREQAVKEKRERKLAKKQAASDARHAANDPMFQTFQPVDESAVAEPPADEPAVDEPATEA